MTEIKNLLARSDRYVKSAKILIEDEDYALKEFLHEKKHIIQTLVRSFYAEN